MTDHVFPPRIVSLAVEGGGGFPVNRVFCVGQNYAAHAREMGADPNAAPPFFFMKPAQAATQAAEIPYPPDTANLHYEAELVIAIGPDGVFGCAVGCDLTKRDRQGEQKQAGRPWERGKAFDLSAPISAIRPMRAIPARGRIALSVNGVVKQDGDLAAMIHDGPRLIERLADIWTLAPGDLIFTGTPEGVGPLQRGDAVRVEIEAVGALGFAIV